jgi:hypothetical protein
MAAGLQAWMEQPGNIAALARWLEARDLSGFDAYAPPETDTKTVMQELARSELDDAFAAVRRRIGPRGLFTGEQIRAAITMELGDVMSTDDMRRWVSRRIRQEATQIKEFRMPPMHGRHKILGWRGSSSAWVKTEETARSAVAGTAKVVLADGSADGIILHLPPTPGKAP